MLSFVRTKTEHDLDELEAFCHWCIKKLRLSRYPIALRLRKRLSGQRLGVCTGEGTGVAIELSLDQSRADLLDSLAHELVHARQMKSGILHQIDGKLLYRGIPIGDLPPGMEEEELPYEKEARKKAAKLVGDWLEEQDNGRII